MAALGLTPQTVLVTGANRGLGLEMVKQLLSATKPPKVLFAAFRGTKESEKAKELRILAADHSNLHLVSLDVTNEESIAQAGEEVRSTLKGQGLNLLINNAGVNPRTKTLDTVTVQTLTDTYAVNVIGTMMVTKAFLGLVRQAAQMSKSKAMGWTKAAIINVSSILGSITFAGSSEDVYHGELYAYRTSKAAVNQFTKTLSIELEGEGVLAVTMHPGWVRTDMGGQRAPLSPEASISSLLATISALDNKAHGKYIKFDGKELPW